MAYTPYQVRIPGAFLNIKAPYQVRIVGIFLNAKPATAAGGVTYPQLERGIRGLNRGIATGMY